MFTVTGTIDSILYRVGIHPAALEGELHGCVMGSTHATALLSLHVGDWVQQSPTHGAVRLALDDPLSVLAALQTFTTVIVVEGVLPRQAGVALRGAIY
ncbi:MULTISPECIES: hypothetical protein [unclassified Nocardioides]|uniref:hypothetical protein n=1 Tax=unclassified Nocardioides TaxID=2615069 RepID=UPI0000570854|nr:MULTISPECIES: hypothetical protein [unclassified Nocardioides]ABL80604.1 hypothetical protein Noca_1087 [Nocardioides sp. JS614]